ncbi:hypothetical protein L2X99_16240 [Microbacterium sp. KUDC0406]|uniref:hypothetical protein n=1 Tax=Microbacterium sp. KUDC0406 TaxID=2909588 RepID=UPI001F3655A5|nr:hypothetical protein [Microbacterium sp. KUDC0406]UJP09901.1 hypothetical protein L2X99_16240 [Microbacterium sp. KUDC0406]
MKGKIGLVVGLGVGYVLGSRAGRERYEQIKTQWLKVWNLDPVQQQVTRVQDFAKEKAAAVPQALWDGAVRVVRSASAPGTPGQKLDSAIDTAKDAADDVSDAAGGCGEGCQAGRAEEACRQEQGRLTWSAATGTAPTTAC